MALKLSGKLAKGKSLKAGKGKKEESKTSKGKKSTGSKKGKTPSWMMKGSEAGEAFEQEEAEQTERREANARLFRFRIKEDEECLITFVDGDIITKGDKKGLFSDSVPVFYEHSVKMGPRKWSNFICVAEDGDPCPLCLMDNRRYLAAAFTVIDHRTYTSERSGKEYTNQLKLFIAKTQTWKKLKKRAAKYGELTGWTVEVGRTSDRAAAVGDEFEWDDQNTLADLAEEYGLESILEGTDYEKELPYLDPSELKKLGFTIDGDDETGGGEGEEEDDLPGDGDVPF